MFLVNDSHLFAALRFATHIFIEAFFEWMRFCFYPLFSLFAMRGCGDLFSASVCCRVTVSFRIIRRVVSPAIILLHLGIRSHSARGQVVLSRLAPRPYFACLNLSDSFGRSPFLFPFNRAIFVRFAQSFKL